MAQFTLYSHAGGPNGWTVAFLLKALGLTYETKYLDFGKQEQKSEEFTKLNPNGRIPALVDHNNNDFTVWESKAVLLYLVEKYDTERTFTVGKSIEEQAPLYQWLFFQASGQGPYFGQAAHFLFFAPGEKIPYAIERYKKEVERVFTVLEGVLSKQEWLVGGKLTIADLGFVSWTNFGLSALLPEGVDSKTAFPAVNAWNDKLNALPYVAEALKEREELMKKQ